MSASQTKTLKGQMLANAQFESETAAAQQKDNTRRRLAGNAPAEVKALVLLVSPCGDHKLKKVTKANMEAAFFGNGETSYKSVLNECSRGSVGVSGKVKEVSICPDNNGGVFDISDAVKEVMKNDPDYQAADY